MLAGLPGLRPPLRHPVRRRRGSARPALRRAPAAAGGVLARERPARMDVSPLVAVAGLGRARAAARAASAARPIEGLMLKRKDSPYLAGRPKGQWWKWKRDAHLLDVRADVRPARPRQALQLLLLRLHLRLLARRTGRGRELVPVGKAYSGFTDDELLQLDRWMRDHTTAALRPGARGDAGPGARGRVRFGAPLDPPQVRRGDALSRASSRIRWDKPAAEADRLETLERLIG